MSLLSVVDDGERIRLGRDFDRRCTRASPRLFLCCGMPARESRGTAGGARYSARVGLSRFALRTDLMVWLAADAATGEAGGKPWFTSRREPGSSTISGVGGRDIERGLPGKGLCSGDLGHALPVKAGDRSISLTTASRFDAELTELNAAWWRAEAGARHWPWASQVEGDNRPCS